MLHVHVEAHCGRCKSIFDIHFRFTNHTPPSALHSPHTISNVHANMYCDTSKFFLPTSASKLSSMIFVLSLKIGTNDCNIFKLNDGFSSFRIGFQNAPASDKLKSDLIEMTRKIAPPNLILRAYMRQWGFRRCWAKSDTCTVCRGMSVTWALSWCRRAYPMWLLERVQSNFWSAS